jgi:hypothetical protein
MKKTIMKNENETDYSDSGYWRVYKNFNLLILKNFKNNKTNTSIEI